MSQEQLGEARSFHQSMSEALESVRAGLRTALAEVGIDEPGPTAISRGLSIDKATAWKVSRISQAEPAMAALEYLPGSHGGRSLVSGFRAKGLGEELAAGLEGAFEHAHDVIRDYAGDQETAKAMARALQPGGQRLDLKLRRAHFRTAATVWGGRARVHLKCDIMGPSPDGSTVSVTSLEGILGFQSLQSGVRWRVGSKRVLFDDEVKGARYQSLGEPGCGPLLTEFSPGPGSELIVTRTPSGFEHYEYEAGEPGQLEEVDRVIGTYCPDAFPDRDLNRNVHQAAGAHLRLPVEQLVLDFYLHRSLVPTGDASGGLFAQIKNGPAYPLTGQDQPLSVGASVEELRQSSAVTPLEKVHAYPHMLKEVLARSAKAIGGEPWSLEDLRGYRMVLEYPPIPSFGLISVTYRPAGARTEDAPGDA